MSRELRARPTPALIEGFSIRNWRGEEDVAPWLNLRSRAFSRSKVGVGAWDESDFQREFLDKPWWQPDCLWLVEVESPGGPTGLVGAATLARRGEGPASVPVVHWLLVDPRYRRRGIARWLMSTLEAAAWDKGDRRIALETHARWTEAVALYRSLGYEVLG